MDGTIKNVYRYALKDKYKLKVEALGNNIYRIFAEKEYIEIELPSGVKDTILVCSITQTTKDLIKSGAIKVIDKKVKRQRELIALLVQLLQQINGFMEF